MIWRAVARLMALMNEPPSKPFPDIWHRRDPEAFAAARRLKALAEAQAELAGRTRPVGNAAKLAAERWRVRASTVVRK